MAYIYFCNNPRNRCMVGDCVIRAISCALNKSWNEIYLDVVAEGYFIKDMPSSNEVWGSYLYSKGFHRHSVPDTFSYTINDFCEDHPYGTFVIGTGTHAVCVKSGNYYDTWRSGDEQILYYWEDER